MVSVVDARNSGEVGAGSSADAGLRVGFALLGVALLFALWFWEHPWCSSGLTVERALSVALLVLSLVGLVLVGARSRRNRTARGWVMGLAVLIALPSAVVGLVAVRVAFGQDLCVPLLHAL